MAEKKSKTSKKKKKEVKTKKKTVKAEKKSSKNTGKSQKKTASVVQDVSVEKQEIIENFQLKKGDTGSPEVQIGLLTNRIQKLVKHLQSNPSDNHSRRGLLGIVSKRRRLLNYLEQKEEKRYKEIAKRVGLLK